MTRYLAPYVRSYGIGLRSSLPWLQTDENRLLQAPPPAYDEISQYPRELIFSTPRPQELPPPDYETAIRLPPVEVPLPAATEVQNGKPPQADGQSRLQIPVPEESPRMSNLGNQNGTSTEFVSIELPGYSSIRYIRNGTSGPTEGRQQLNGGVTNTVVAENIYNISNRDFSSSDKETTRMKFQQSVCSFIQRVLFTSAVAGVVIYLHTTHPQWMPQWGFIVVTCLLIISVVQHIPPLLREYRNHRFRNHN